MKFVDEYRDPAIAQRLLAHIRKEATRPWTIMEVCGGQTHVIVRSGIDRLLTPSVELVHGPGCPVCVTPLAILDHAHAIAGRPDVIVASFGDMLRVPGSPSSSGDAPKDLLGLRARGADVRVVYSPLDAVEMARESPSKAVVFFGVGFETTAPANAMALREAKRQGLANFSMLASHVLVPPAIASILSASDRTVQALLGPGHVCAVAGIEDYEAIAARYHIPIVITGFEPLDILEGISLAVRQLEEGKARVDNQYRRSVRRGGNPIARALVDEVFEIADRDWRGIGVIPRSGLRIRESYRMHDAERVHALERQAVREDGRCMSGLVLRGRMKPSGCPELGVSCTPSTPLGATMVSAEGACAAYYAHRRPSIESKGKAT